MKLLYDLRRLFSDCCGPHGKIILVGKEHQRDSDEICMTCCSSGILNFDLLEFSSDQQSDEEIVFQKTIKSFLKSHNFQYGFYGSSFGLLTCIMYILFKEDCENYSLFKLNYLLQNVVPQWMDEFFDRQQIPVQALSLKILLSIMKTKWCGNKLLRLSSHHVNVMSALSVRIFSHVFLPKFGSSQSIIGRKNDVNYVQLYGEGITYEDSVLKKGLIMNIPFPEIVKSVTKSKNIQNKKIIVFKESILLTPPKSEEAYTESNLGAMIKLRSSGEENTLDLVKERIKEWKQSGIEIVACQKLIDKPIQLLMLKHDIIPIERISQFYIDDVIRLTGASPISSIVFPIQKSDIGQITSISEIQVMGRSCIYFTNETAESEVYSVLLCSPSHSQSLELEHVMKSAQTGLKLLVSQPFVVAGSGVTEFLLAQYFTEQSRLDKSRIFSILSLQKEMELITRSLNMLSKTIAQKESSNMILEEYVLCMKQKNCDLSSSLTPSKHGLVVTPTYSCFSLNSQVTESEAKEVLRYSVEFDRTTQTMEFNIDSPNENEERNMILDISFAKKQAIASAFQCFHTLMQSTQTTRQ
ncbi:hypothetical protein C9374_000966 [Naegleria lovaniensis]|uniref:Uncharacterized protein n=1 Tax=Naegleria lovaniensis TaxID=51637 RepID=A0AA88GY54_NAELO|nr:uncharacterized protein C9374_000966 [Naegleria lovaniensis]KAG2388116.1 hypothetical protein C9374_000966 [Naegleria lovaniensis]